ncbi:RDD family protein [Actinotalea sp. BY-33]|uniref:RDD family protein n=1 Tax=Actinotalea soli TaxID=2819234 RepID=A0A939LQP5_9CELL|nr:RDD family protein [Actinotalea soli]MBO1752671.1 RDD family protein [Actinotalea soli]
MATAGGGPQDGTRPAPGPPFEETLEAPDLDPGYASWSRRVVAHLLDGAILGSIGVLAAGGLDGAESRVIALTPGLGPSPWLDAPVLWVAALLLLTMQAYVGSTPGKLVVGICVVDLDEERPIGLLRTLGRWVTHVLDSILLVGYVRPLWHPQNQTYADTLLRTVVLQTSTPRPHPWLAGRGTEAWRRPLTFAAGALCLVALAVSCGPSGERTSNEIAPDARRVVLPVSGNLVEGFGKHWG